MPAQTPTFRTPAAPALTLRTRMSLAVARRFAPARAARSALPVQRLAGSEGSSERMDLDQRVRQVGEW